MIGYTQLLIIFERPHMQQMFNLASVIKIIISRNKMKEFYLWPTEFGREPEISPKVTLPSKEEVTWQTLDGTPRIEACSTLGETNAEIFGADLLAICIAKGKAVPFCSDKKRDLAIVRHGYMCEKRLNKSKKGRQTLYLYWLTQKGVDTLMNKIPAHPLL